MSAERQARKAFKKWVEDRRKLAQDWWNIQQVKEDMNLLVDELERRRDGLPAQKVELTHLRRAMLNVDTLLSGNGVK
jgi:hypothetical protein